MAFYVSTQYGEPEDDVSPDRMEAILGGINPDDAEHPDVSLVHDSGWCVSVFASGLVTFGNVRTRDSARHQRLAGPLEALPLWQLLADGKLAALEAMPWLPGYGGDVD